jgi:hypothetical protein
MAYERIVELDDEPKDEITPTSRVSTSTAIPSSSIRSESNITSSLQKHNTFQTIHSLTEEDIIHCFRRVSIITRELSTTRDHKTTFARQLQRAALERCWSLINAKIPNPVCLNEVFGFCLLYETREQIMLRLKRALDATSKDSLFHWRAPIAYLGGRGTYCSLEDDIGGTMVPKFQTGRSMGPFSPTAISTSETAMFDDFRIDMPSFEGEFFDSNDVEGYLRGRGIDIPPNVEFITIDLDQLHLQGISSPRGSSDNSTNNPLDLAGPIFNTASIPQASMDRPTSGMPHPEKRLVTLSVFNLIEGKLLFML